MNFASDNVYGVHPAIMQSMADANSGTQSSYGSDEFTKRAERQLCEIFEREVDVYLVLTGTAANSLCLSAMVPPYGGVLCHSEAHIMVDECGAPELFTGGAKLIGIPDPAGKLTTASITRVLDGFIRGEHDPKPKAVSITQATELGTVYSLDEIRAIADLAHGRGLRLHMDGARFTNALVSLGCTPAEMTWKAGVDALSFGATKNGAMMLEAVIFFDRSLSEDFIHRRMRSAQLLSKGRYLGAQMNAYLDNDLWLNNASHANEIAAYLASELKKTGKVRLPLPVQANEVFPIMPRGLYEHLQAAGAVFYEWPGEGPGTEELIEGNMFVRFVCSYMTTKDQCDALVAEVKKWDGRV
jgi:threonine aldolase